MHAVADCCGDDCHRVCSGIRDIEVSTVPESTAVPVPQHSHGVNDSVGGVTSNVLHLAASQRLRLSDAPWLNNRRALGPSIVSLNTNNLLLLHSSSCNPPQAFDPGAPSCIWCHGEAVSQVTRRSCPRLLFPGRCGPHQILAVMIAIT
jgi:hypothetical protein